MRPLEPVAGKEGKKGERGKGALIYLNAIVSEGKRRN